MTDSEDAFDWDAVNREVGSELSDDVLQYAVTPSQMRNRIMRDVVPDEQVVAVAKLMGIHASSQDVEDMEMKESHSRLREVAPLVPALGMLSAFAAEAVSGAIMDATGAPVFGKDFAEMSEKLQPAVYMTAVAMLAELIDLGYLHLPHYGIIQIGSIGE